jgi:hypothetical protein
VDDPLRVASRRKIHTEAHCLGLRTPWIASAIPVENVTPTRRSGVIPPSEVRRLGYVVPTKAHNPTMPGLAPLESRSSAEMRWAELPL